MDEDAYFTILSDPSSLKGQIESQISSELVGLRLICKILICLWLVGYFLVLWLVASTGQPLKPLSDAKLEEESNVEASLRDLLLLLELSTDSYVVMQSSLPAASAYQKLYAVY